MLRRQCCVRVQLWTGSLSHNIYKIRHFIKRPRIGTSLEHHSNQPGHKAQLQRSALGAAISSNVESPKAQSLLMQETSFPTPVGVAWESQLASLYAQIPTPACFDKGRDLVFPPILPS